MKPEESDRIRAATLSVIGEIKSQGAFYQRNKARLGQIEAALINWNADDDYQDSIDYIRDGVRKICASIPAGVASRATCEEFLETA